ncbi:MAG: 2'-5' RNA ligase family protein, partial [Actinomycetota bacterium]
AALELLQDRLERGCEAIGFPPEGAPFQPHITLGRVKEGQRCPPRALEEFREAYQRAPFVASQLVLYESVLTTRGPRYEPRLTLELAE